MKGCSESITIAKKNKNVVKVLIMEGKDLDRGGKHSEGQGDKQGGRREMERGKEECV